MYISTAAFNQFGSFDSVTLPIQCSSSDLKTTTNKQKTKHNKKQKAQKAKTKTKEKTKLLVYQAVPYHRPNGCGFFFLFVSTPESHRTNILEIFPECTDRPLHHSKDC